ncbi:hypothetical protein, partial [Enterobacter hormaechei]|uniref:hypothetical protein n=1 Tax=Enterobacter hormaechei TaxID=158836 RepID=UPI00197F05AB
IKLRGQTSQGLALPLSTLPIVRFVMCEEMDDVEVENTFNALNPAQQEEARQIVGALHADTPIRDLDLSFLLGVEKYEAPLPAELAGQAAGLFPSFIQKTDQE